MRWLCLLAVMLLVGAAPVKPDLLERAAQSSGEPWRYHIVSRITATQTQTDEQGDLVVTQRCRGIVCRGTVVNASSGRVAFFSYNGTPIPQAVPIDPSQITLRSIVSYAFTSPAFTAGGGTVVPLPQRRLGDARVAPFAVTAPHGAELDALLDPRSGLLVGVAQGHTAIYRYADERRVGPLMLPFEVLQGDGTSQTFDDRQVVNAGLVPPAGPEVGFALKPAPIALAPGTLPRFPCRIEDVPARCVLDTGASGLAMSLTLADRLGKKLVGELDIEGLGAVASGVVRAESLQLGSMRIGPALYAVLPDAGGFGADVLVGTDAIDHAIVRIDPKRLTIEFVPPGSLTTGTRVPLSFEGFVPSVPIRLGSLEEHL
ncbi:MAG: aspartyl protease family protein, partial [Vulcanimicrobiaceae bacterium]